MSRHSNLRLLDILDAMGRIASYVEGMSYEDFLVDRRTQDAVIRNIEIIGEAARSLPADFTERHEDVPWSDIIGMRNILVHQYFGILPEVVWDVIKNELPALRAQIAKL
jgi:uncharacterized protein with HEPN domain